MDASDFADGANDFVTTKPKARTTPQANSVDWEATLRAGIDDPDPNVRAEMQARLAQMTPGLSPNFAADGPAAATPAPAPQFDFAGASNDFAHSPSRQAGTATEYASEPASGPLSFSMGGTGPMTSSEPASPNAVGAPSPLSGSNWQDVAAGAGKSVADAGRGLRQVGALIGNKLGLVDNATVQGIQSEVDEAQRLDSPLMKSPAGIGGYLGGSIASALVPGGIVAKGADLMGAEGLANAARTMINPQTYKAATAVGAIQGALQPVATGDSRSANAAIGALGGAGGNLLANTASRIAVPVRNMLGDAAQTLTNNGVPLDAAQQSGSAFLGRIKDTLADNPFTAGAQRELADTQQSAFNRAALKTIGEDADAATPDVMQAAKSRIGAVYDDVASRTNIAYDPTLENSLASIERQARQTLNDQQYGVITRNLNNIVDKAAANNGALSGQQYQAIKQSLDRISGGSDQSVGEAARDIRQTLQDGIARSAAASGNNADVAALQQANLQWGNMRKIESAVGTDGDGSISPAKLANVFGQKKNRYVSVYGQGNTDLNDLAQAGKKILSTKTPQSGSVPRALGQIAMASGVGAGVGAYEGDPWKGAEAAVGLYGLPKLLQYGMNSPRIAGYVGNGLSQTPLKNLLLAPQTLPLAGGAVRRLPLSVVNRPKAQSAADN